MTKLFIKSIIGNGKLLKIENFELRNLNIATDTNYHVQFNYSHLA